MQTNDFGQRSVVVAVVSVCIFAACGMAKESEPPALLQTSPVEPPPRNTGPAAVAHTRTRIYRRKTVRVIRRTPEVMREDAARVPRGELFRTWSNEYLQ
ncbi:MAG: hypothetical protein WCQ91_01995 [Planctomycetota bacterium]